MSNSGLRHGVAIALFLAGACGVLAACGGRPPDTGGAATESSDLIQIDGSSTVFPVTEAVAEEFQKANSGTRVTVGLSGTGGGFKKFCRGEIDISDASRPIQPTELEECGKAGVTFTELPVAYDGLAVLVHPKNTWAASITVAELKRIWEPEAQGNITRWSQVRPGWPDRELHLFGPGTDSGTFDYFTEVITGKAKASRGDYTASEDDNVLVQGIANDEEALGYFGLAYYEENQERLKLVPVDDGQDNNGQGPIAPTMETVRGGTYRPLSRPLFIYVNHKSLSRPAVARFTEFYLGDRGQLAREVGYVPLSDREYELASARYQARTGGTMYAAEGHTGATLEALLSKAQ
jgi:phosphate transport system substrate-binding protein